MLSRPGLWAVADGMGGHACGAMASALVVEHLGAVGAGGPLVRTAGQLREALDDANRRLVLMGGETPGGTIGSTVVALAAVQNAFICLWAGDSRAYRVRAGSITQLTSDHSLVQLLVDAGEIAADAAADHPDANVVTRAVGAAAELSVDAIEGEVAAGDTLLLASDGLTRVVGEAELLHHLAWPDIEAAADALLAVTLARGAPDNVSFVIVRAA